jgi:PAS domain S-box-containing protein
LDVQQAIEKGTATPPRLYRVTRKDGCQRHVEITLRTSGKFLISSFNDLTERIESEIQLRKLSRAVEQSPVSIVITDAAGVIEYVNPRFSQVTGYTATEVMGQTPNFLKSDDAPPESFQQLWQTITAGKDWHGEFHNRKKNGELFWERATISPIFDKASQITHFLALKEDISAQRQLELQLRQSQKMEAIGLLAGGVAHDFNNVLTVIQGNASLMTQPGLSPEEYLEYASQISAASGRAANLTRQLLMFSRKQVIQPTSLDLNDTVSQVSRMLQRILGEDINLISHYSSSLPVIRGDAGMIEQIIMNLSVNARDAMPNGGNLTITTSLGYLDEDNRVPAVCLSVTDTGCGISDEHLQHIFEPFFTTKEYGKGTGLGLATVESIVQQHHGKILVSSRVGEGSTFLIRFPVATQAKVEPAKPVVSHFPAGTETILVVEDEAPVRVFVGKLLERCGYRILRAESGIDALAVWLEHRDNIDLLLTDIIMPGGVNGYELAARLQDDNPQLKVIYTSGYTGDMTGKRSLLVEGVNFLQKPYPPQKLAELLRRVLDAQRSVPVLAGE